MKKYIIVFSLLTPLFLLVECSSTILLFYLTNNLVGVFIYSAVFGNILQIILSVLVGGSLKKIVVTVVHNNQ